MGEGPRRDRALGQKRGFRPLNTTAKREQLRFVADLLAKGDGFHHLQKIWDEERFFTALLSCVDEARMAGLHDMAAIERVKAMLDDKADGVTREAYADLWSLLIAYEARLSGQDDERFDEASLLRLAAEVPDVSGGPYFLLGFDQLGLLEVEFLQALAHDTEIIIPLALSDEKLAEIIKGRDQVLEHPAALALRGLITNFPGEVAHDESDLAQASSVRRFLEGAYSR